MGVTTELPVVLLLDLAIENPIYPDLVLDQLPPGVSAHIYRATDYGAARSPTGSPAQWDATIAALERMVEAARIHEQSTPVRYWIAGRAGLPAFFHVGHLLSRHAAITVVNRRADKVVDVLPLDAPRGGSPYFTMSPWPPVPSRSPGRIALLVSSGRHIAAEPAEAAIVAAGGPHPSAVVEAQSPAFVAEAVIGTIRDELDRIVADLRRCYPASGALGVFVAGPASLAVAVGALLNPHTFPDLQVFEHRSNRYALAYHRARPTRHPLLFVAANPLDTTRLALAEEQRDARQALEGAPHLEIESRGAVSIEDLLSQLREIKPSILHFSGHGRADGELVLQRDRISEPLTAAGLAAILQATAWPRLIILNACHTFAMAAELSTSVDCVIAMEGKVLDDAAREFTRVFYKALGADQSVQRAFDQACAVWKARRPSEPAPRCLPRPGFDASALHFPRP